MGDQNYMTYDTTHSNRTRIKDYLSKNTGMLVGFHIDIERLINNTMNMTISIFIVTHWGCIHQAYDTRL